MCTTFQEAKIWAEKSVTLNTICLNQFISSNKPFYFWRSAPRCFVDTYSFFDSKEMKGIHIFFMKLNVMGIKSGP
jgi:hypothetical protein